MDNRKLVVRSCSITFLHPHFTHKETNLEENRFEKDHPFTKLIFWGLSDFRVYSLFALSMLLSLVIRIGTFGCRHCAERLLNPRMNSPGFLEHPLYSGLDEEGFFWLMICGKRTNTGFLFWWCFAYGKWCIIFSHLNTQICIMGYTVHIIFMVKWGDKDVSCSVVGHLRI